MCVRDRYQHTTDSGMFMVVEPAGLARLPLSNTPGSWNGSTTRYDSLNGISHRQCPLEQFHIEYSYILDSAAHTIAYSS